MLPEGWTRMAVADICSLQNGHGFGPEDWGTEGLPIIRIQNLNGGDDFDYYNGDVDPRWLVEPGQLLFAWAGTRGVSFGPTVWRAPRGVLNQHIFKVSPKQGIDGDWLYWALRHVTNRIEAHAHGFKSTLVHVKKSDIDRQEVLVPPLKEQRFQAALLGTWSQAVATATKLQVNSQKHGRVLAHNLALGKQRLHRHVNSNERALTRHGTFPRDWRLLPIESVAQEVNRRNAENAALPVLSCTKHSGLVDSLGYFKKRVFSADTSTYKVVERGCFAYATNHIEEGSIGYQNLYDEALISPMYTVFQVSNDVDPGYLYKLLKTEHYRQIFQSKMNASVDRRGSLRWSEFRKIEIALPPLDEQRAISAVINAAKQEADIVAAQLAALDREKRAILDALMSGRQRTGSTLRPCKSIAS